MRSFNAVITGVGGYVPDKIITNEDICKLVDTSDEWITSRTGIKERRKLDIPGAGSSYMGTKAVQELLEKTGTNPLDIEVVICSTNTPDFILPATATLIVENCGLKNAYGWDLGAACSGFIFALTQGAALIEAGRYKKVIVVASEAMTTVTNYNDRTTCALFGDGSAAVLLEPTTEPYGVIDSVHYTDGSGLSNLLIKAGGSAKPASHESVDNEEHFIFQEGQAVFKAAVTRLVEASEEIKTQRSEARRCNLGGSSSGQHAHYRCHCPLHEGSFGKCHGQHSQLRKYVIRNHTYLSLGMGKQTPQRGCAYPLCFWCRFLLG